MAELFSETLWRESQRPSQRMKCKQAMWPSPVTFVSLAAGAMAEKKAEEGLDYISAWHLVWSGVGTERTLKKMCVNLMEIMTLHE